MNWLLAMDNKKIMPARYPSPRLLQLFAAVVRTGSVTRAAEELFLSQPAVSQQLKRLEQLLGHKLLEQRHQRLLPTAAGQELLHTAREVDEALADLDSRLAALSRGERGQLRLAVVNTAEVLVPQLLGAFAAEHPGIELQLRVGNRQQVIERFNSYSDHFYLFSQPPDVPGLAACAIIRNPLVVIAPAGQAAEGPRDLAWLCQQRVLVREEGSGTRQALAAHLRQNHLHLQRPMLLESNNAILLGVASGLGVAVISQHVVAHGRADVQTLAVEGFPLPSHWYLVWHRGRRLPQAAQRFAYFLHQQLAALLPAELLEPELALLPQLLEE